MPRRKEIEIAREREKESERFGVKRGRVTWSGGAGPRISNGRRKSGQEEEERRFRKPSPGGMEEVKRRERRDFQRDYSIKRIKCIKSYREKYKNVRAQRKVQCLSNERFLRERERAQKNRREKKVLLSCIKFGEFSDL